MVIKLSSENKINAKNSWNLDLIDHMGQLIKEDSKKEVNFQKASCTLDASIKIYSHRVDDTWSSSFRILENLSRNGGDGNFNDEDDDDDDDRASGANGTTTRRAAKVGSRSASARLGLINTIEKNAKSLNMTQVDGENVTDPMFQKMSKAFDEGGAKGMLMNNLRLASSSCSLVFSSNDVAGAAPKKVAVDKSAAAGVSTGLLCDLLNRLNIAPSTLAQAPVCPILRDYRQTIGIEIASSSAAMSTLPAPTMTTLPRATEHFSSSAAQATSTPSQESLAAAVSAPDCGAYDDGCDDSDDYFAAPDAGSEDIPEEPVAGTPAGSENGGKWNSLFGGPAADTSGSGNAASGGATVEWDGLGVSNADEYCFFNVDGLLATAGSNKWAGAKHWKFAVQKRRNAGALDQKADTAPVVAKVAKGKQPGALFNFYDATMLDVGLFAPPAAPKRKVKGAAPNSSMFSDNMLAKQMNDSGSWVLPTDSKIELHDLCRLFLRPNMIAPPVSMLSLFKPKEGSSSGKSAANRYVGSSSGSSDLIWGVCTSSASNAGSSSVIDTAVVDEAANDVGSGQYMTESGEIIYDNNFAGGDDDCDDDAGVDGCMGGSSPGDDADDADSIVRDLTESLATGLSINTENLLQAKRTVGKINVGYATSAKLVNVKKLKTDIWSCIESGVQPTLPAGEEKASGKENASTSPVAVSMDKHGSPVLSFQNVVRQVATSSSTRQKDASLSFYFISLLHLANEKCLAIGGSDGMNDLTIGYGKPAPGAAVTAH